MSENWQLIDWSVNWLSPRVLKCQKVSCVGIPRANPSKLLQDGLSQSSNLCQHVHIHHFRPSYRQARPQWSSNTRELPWTTRPRWADHEKLSLGLRWGWASPDCVHSAGACRDGLGRQPECVSRPLPLPRRRYVFNPLIALASGREIRGLGKTRPTGNSSDVLVTFFTVEIWEYDALQIF